MAKSKEYTVTFTAECTIIIKDIPKGKVPAPNEELAKTLKEIIEQTCEFDDVVIDNVKIFEAEKK